MGRAKPWTPEEDALLRQLIAEELTYQQIEDRAGISKSRAHKRANELGISWGRYQTPSRLNIARQIREGILNGESDKSIAERLGTTWRKVKAVKGIMFKEKPDLKVRLYRKRSVEQRVGVLSESSKEAIEEINAYWRARGKPYRAWWDFDKRRIVSDIPTVGV